MRLIDADEFDKCLENIEIEARRCRKNIGADVINMIRGNLTKASTVDAIEVVRCKDCRWGKEVCGNIECSVDLNLPPEYHGYEWYCPNGERRFEDEIN